VDDEEVCVLDLDDHFADDITNDLKEWQKKRVAAKASGAAPAAKDAAKDDDVFWTMVPNDDPASGTLIDTHDDVAGPAAKRTEQSHLSGERYALVDDHDIMDAVAEFSALCVQFHPQAKDLTPTQLNTMLTQSFSTLKKPGLLTRIWRWGNFAYSCYGWGQYAFYVYQSPYVWKGATYVCKYVFFLLAP